MNLLTLAFMAVTAENMLAGVAKKVANNIQPLLLTCIAGIDCMATREAIEIYVILIQQRFRMLSWFKRNRTSST